MEGDGDDGALFQPRPSVWAEVEVTASSTPCLARRCPIPSPRHGSWMLAPASDFFFKGGGRGQFEGGWGWGKKVADD